MIKLSLKWEEDRRAQMHICDKSLLLRGGGRERSKRQGRKWEQEERREKKKGIEAGGDG